MSSVLTYKVSVYRMFSICSLVLLWFFGANNGFAQSGVIRGVVYFDFNKDCNKGSFDPGLVNRMVKAFNPTTQSTFYSLTDSFGVYSFSNLDTNSSYLISLPVDSGLYRNYKTVPGCVIQHVAIAHPQPGQSYNLGLTINDSTYDMSVRIKTRTGWQTQNGKTERYILVVQNQGSEDVNNAQLKFTIPNGTNFIAATPGFTRNGQDLTWNVRNLPPAFVNSINYQREYLVDVSIPSSIPVGSYLNFKSEGNYALDRNQDDNENLLVQSVTNTVSPTYKSCYPTYLTPTTDRIQFFIRFQNTTGSTVNKVTVYDTLDTSLPITDVRIGSASHTYKFSVSGNVLIWEFFNLNLPDSSVNSNNSIGYLYFSCGVRTGMSRGDSVKNTAYVKFDNLVPTATNTVVAKMNGVGTQDLNSKLDWTAWQNSSTESSLQINNDRLELLSLDVFDISGRKVGSYKISAKSNEVINLPELGTGIYILRDTKFGTFRKIYLNR